MAMTPPTQSILEMTAWEAKLHAAESKNFEVILHLETAACIPVLDARVPAGGGGGGGEGGNPFSQIFGSACSNATGMRGSNGNLREQMENLPRYSTFSTPTG